MKEELLPILNKRILNETLIKSLVNTTELFVLSIRQNKSINFLVKILEKLNYITNYKTNRYSLKKNRNKNKHPRVEFYCFNQYAKDNTHTHLFLKVASCYDYDKVVNTIKQEFPKLDVRRNPKNPFEMYKEEVDVETAYTRYSSREYENDNSIESQNTFVVL